MTGLVGMAADAEWLANERRRQKFLDLYLFALDTCLSRGAGRWWQRAFSVDRLADMEAGAEQLKDFALHHVLYEAGDVTAARLIWQTLAQDGLLDGDPEGQFLHSLLCCLEQAMPPIGEGRKRRGFWERRKAVVSIVLPDAAAFEDFMAIGIRSLLGAGGLDFLCQARDTTLLVYARQGHLIELEEFFSVFDCATIVRSVPEGLAQRAEAAPGPSLDRLLGALQAVHLAEAVCRDADFLSINPRGVYGGRYFESLLGLKKPAVLSASFRADRRVLREALLPSIADGSLTIAPEDLVALGLEAAGFTGRARRVQDFRQVRGSTSRLFLMWEGPHCVEIHTTHYEIAFLSRDSLTADAAFMPMAEADRIVVAGTPLHVVGEADGLALVELGPAVEPAYANGEDLAGFGALVGHTTRQLQGELFKQPVRLAVSRRVDRKPVDGATLDQERRTILAALDKARAGIFPGPTQALAAIGTLNQHEVSEYGRETLATTIAEGRRLIDLVPIERAVSDDGALRELVRAAMNFDHLGHAIALAERGKVPFIRDFLAAMMRLKTANIERAAALRRAAPRRKFALVGSVVWGPAYVDKFLAYCLPSLLAPGNIAALARKGRVVHSIVTTESDRDRIMAHPLYRRLSELAEVAFTCFPAAFLEARAASGYDFYRFYGMLDHQSVFLAAALGADLYLLPIDCVYSADCLKNFNASIASDADACAVAGVEAEAEPLADWLDGRSRDATGALVLPAPELLQAACERLDAYHRSLVMTAGNRAFCRHPRELIWPVAEGLAVHSIFMHPLAVSGRLLSRPFHPQHENVDFALLPRLLQADGRMKVIGDAREAVIVQFGAPPMRQEYVEGGFSLRDFLEVHRYDYAVQRQFFAARQVFPCHGLDYPLAADYEAELAAIAAALVRHRFRSNRR